MPVSVNYGVQEVRFRGVPMLSAMSWFIWAGLPEPETPDPNLIDLEHLPLTRIDDETGYPSEPFDKLAAENFDLKSIMRPEEVEKDLARIKVPTLVSALGTILSTRAPA